MLIINDRSGLCILGAIILIAAVYVGGNYLSDLIDMSLGYYHEEEEEEY